MDVGSIFVLGIITQHFFTFYTIKWNNLGRNFVLLATNKMFCHKFLSKKKLGHFNFEFHIT